MRVHGSSQQRDIFRGGGIFKGGDISFQGWYLKGKGSAHPWKHPLGWDEALTSGASRSGITQALSGRWGSCSAVESPWADALRFLKREEDNKRR